MNGTTAYALSKAYVEATLQGAGALKGQDGKDGADGKDAYALAVEKGFEGTNEEWLESLKGADGKDGENGKDGVDGQNGKDGVDGHSPTIVENENNDNTIYKLDITDKNGTFTTPNLMGQGGTGGNGDENIIESISVNGTQLPVTDKNVDIAVPTAPIQSISKDGVILETNEDGNVDITTDKEIVKLTDAEYVVLTDEDKQKDVIYVAYDRKRIYYQDRLLNTGYKSMVNVPDTAESFNNGIATGENSHAENDAIASAKNTHAEGKGTEAASENQHVQGKYNVVDSEGKYAHIIGNGTGAGTSRRKNAHTVDWEGNAWYQGDIKVGGTSYDDANTISIERELTMADYEALSDEEKNNGTNYYITDVDNNGNITGYVAGTGIQISEDKTISVTDISKNYIDNSDFCINQNGQTEYTEAGNAVDRWYTDGGILTVKKNGVTFTNTNTEAVLTRLKQELPYSFNEFAGKTITISTKVNGQIYSKTATLPSEKPTTESGTATQFIALSANEWALNLNYSITADYFVPYFALAAGYSMDIEWVKMEVNDARTVYIEPDYSTELLKINFTGDRGELDLPYTKKETDALFVNLPFKWQLLGTSSPSTQENENTIFSQTMSNGLPFVVFHANGVFCFGDGAHKGTLFGNTSCAICNVTYTEAGLLTVSVGQGVAYIYQMINITV